MCDDQTIIVAHDVRIQVRASEPPEPVDGGWLLRGHAVEVAHDGAAERWYRHGWNSWSPTGWTSLADEPLRIYDDPERLLTADDAATDRPDVHAGSAVGALELADGRVLLLGGLDLGAPAVQAGPTALTGVAEVSAMTWLLVVDDEQAAFERYASALTARYGRAGAHTGPVWSSWYSFFEDVDEQRVRDVLDDISGYGFDVVQIDDGWQPIVGDWHAGARFPSGLESMATRIHEAGFRAGLWVAPLICLPESRTAVEHPDWLVCDDDGSPLVAGYNWGSHYFALDSTLPAVQEHLHERFTALTAAGFDYFKLDFMYAGALAGRRHADVHRDFAYRDAIELIRAAVGPEVYLLGSGVPMLPSVGVFDGVRVGPDVAPYWDNTERKRDRSGPGAFNSLANSAARLWMSAMYDVDPDVVFLRRRRSLLDDHARQALLDLAEIAGFKSTSDPVAWLDDDERHELRAFLLRRPAVTRLGRHAFRIDDRVVDLESYVLGTPPDMESMVVK